MKHLLVTGAGGQLGQELARLKTAYPGFHFLLPGRDELDITDKHALQHYFDKHPVDACINCAAYTAVDRAEEEVEKARLVNAIAPGWLASKCREAGIPLIHFSTDYVYHNEQNRPFVETDPTTPNSVYARTKLAGERAALEANPHTIIIRTSWVYSSFGHNFVKTMLRLGKERENLRVVFDQIGTPTYAHDLAGACLEIMQQFMNSDDNRQFSGIYHYSNEGVCSWYDFAVAIFQLTGTKCDVEPIETSQYPTPAERPPFSVLNKRKIKEAFGLKVPYWRESLSRCLSTLDDQQP